MLPSYSFICSVDNICAGENPSAVIFPGADPAFLLRFMTLHLLNYIIYILLTAIANRATPWGPYFAPCISRRVYWPNYLACDRTHFDRDSWHFEFRPTESVHNIPPTVIPAHCVRIRQLELVSRIGLACGVVDASAVCRSSSGCT
jgi:hypothetical protein